MAYTTIDKSSLHFNTKLYTGTGSALSITGVGFAPDLSWVKRRSSARGHTICDNVRGDGYNIYPDLNSAESVATAQFTSLDSDGFTLGTDDRVNQSSGTHVSWNWKAGTTSGISAGSQTITPSAYSINATAGIGIYKWSRTGASTTDYFSHGLGATPTMALQKRTDAVQDWYVNFTVRDGSNDRMQLNNTTALADDTTTLPTSTNYYPKSPETGNYITYLFAPVTGFSKFGSYVGNGNADGTFVYTGFKPAWFMVKRISSGYDWAIKDNKRSPINEVTTEVYSNDTAGDATGGAIDFLSNGLKMRNTSGTWNASSEIYVYMAFAEEPFVASNNDSATAR